MTVHAAGVEIRPVRDTEVDSAIELVAATITEIPLFQWLLGGYSGDEAVRRWIAEFFVLPHVPIGRVEAAVQADGSIGGIVVWSAPDAPGQPLPKSVEETSAEILRRRPDILDRLRELQTVIVAERHPGDYVEILLGVVAPALRGTGVPAQLGMRARRAAADAGLGIAMSTTDLALGKAHERTYGAELQNTYPIGAVTAYSYYVSPEQTRSVLT